MLSDKYTIRVVRDDGKNILYELKKEATGDQYLLEVPIKHQEHGKLYKLTGAVVGCAVVETKDVAISKPNNPGGIFDPTNMDCVARLLGLNKGGMK